MDALPRSLSLAQPSGPGSNTYDLPDRLGSAWRQSTATSSGSVSNRNYDAFGLTLSTMGSPVGPFGYAATSGYQEDADSGLKLLGHRYYDASTGRFLSRDPVKDGRNWYGYCGNNPTGLVDVDGLGSGPEGGPPKVPVPRSGPGNGWKWNPSPKNGREAVGALESPSKSQAEMAANQREAGIRLREESPTGILTMAREFAKGTMRKVTL